MQQHTHSHTKTVINEVVAGDREKQQEIPRGVMRVYDYGTRLFIIYLQLPIEAQCRVMARFPLCQHEVEAPCPPCQYGVKVRCSLI